MASAILKSDFFLRPTLTVARELLGKRLCREIDGKIHAYLITEVEAYDGFDDKASHAFGQSDPKRSRVMFGEPGHWYVYLCYGIHQMLNVVTREAGYPAAVLIRGVKDIPGPGRVGKALQINKQLNTLSATPASGLWIEDSNIKVKKSDILATPRVGVDYAGPTWAKKPWRFVWNGGQVQTQTPRRGT